MAPERWSAKHAPGLGYGSLKVLMKAEEPDERRQLFPLHRLCGLADGHGELREMPLDVLAELGEKGSVGGDGELIGYLPCGKRDAGT